MRIGELRKYKGRDFKGTAKTVRLIEKHPKSESETYYVTLYDGKGKIIKDRHNLYTQYIGGIVAVKKKPKLIIRKLII